MAIRKNPFRPGAGQFPIYLAGRVKERDRFDKLLEQDPVIRNAIITGLRGVGKTVLLESFRDKAQQAGWLWTGADLTESASLSEDRIAKRLITDLSALLRPILVKRNEQMPFGFIKSVETTEIPLEFNDLWKIFEQAPGLTVDKIKSVLRSVRDILRGSAVRGIVFAYDEAQNLVDRAKEKEFPLSILLDSFASLQRDRHEINTMLVLTGLPTLFTKMNEARTYSERMFDVLILEKLSDIESSDAIRKPIEISKSELTFSDKTVEEIVGMSGGYPYFIQYICKEIFDSWIGLIGEGEVASVASKEILDKLDQDFFAARWDRATDRQQEFMSVIATLDNADKEFTIQEIVAASKISRSKEFSPSHATQILGNLFEKGLIYRNKHGKYSFAVPLMAEFIRRQRE